MRDAASIARFKSLLAHCLRRDADLHEAGEVWKVGEDFDDVEDEIRENEHDDEPNYHLCEGLMFWDAWIDSRNHNFSHYKPLTKDDWPRLARKVAAIVESQGETDDEEILWVFENVLGMK